MSSRTGLVVVSIINSVAILIVAVTVIMLHT